MTSNNEALIVRGRFVIHVRPRAVVPWEAIPDDSIALDGIVRGGPLFDGIRRRVNFDHHDVVVREATMSTCMQVFFALKGGLMRMFGDRVVHVFVNDTDQDTSLAAWLLLNHEQFEGTSSVPHINRLVALTDRLDVTGGAFPMVLREKIVRQHTWVFAAYAAMRKSGALACANGSALASNLEATLSRLDRFLMNDGGEQELDTRLTILHDDPRFKVVDEIGGNKARYFLFSQGMDAYLSIVALRPDGRLVCTIGRRSRYIPFPLPRLYDALNVAEGRTREDGWNGSDIVGGSSRMDGTGLSWEQQRDIILDVLKAR